MGAKSQKARRLVVKFGTQSLCEEGGPLGQWLRTAIMQDAANQIHAAICQGVEVLIVSSGAVQAGKEHRWVYRRPIERLNKQELAGIGWPYLFSIWTTVFSYHSRELASVVLTQANWDSESERCSLNESLRTYLREGVIPILNENDVISDREIRRMEQGISENDRLTRLIAELVEADVVLFLTSVGGVYEADPHQHPEARRYTELDVRQVGVDLPVYTNGVSASGSGGMDRKLTEAAACARQGKRVAIASVADQAILRFALGEPAGTTLGTLNRFA